MSVVWIELAVVAEKPLQICPWALVHRQFEHILSHILDLLSHRLRQSDVVVVVYRKVALIPCRVMARVIGKEAIDEV